jgi:uncharacterized protein (DUF2141 family)
MKRFALMALLAAVPSAFPQDKGKSDTHELTVTVTDIPGKEDIVIALFADKKGFPEDTSKAVTTATVKANKATHTFDKLPAGKYVVVVFQDKDGDGKITKGGLGPKEPIGLSNHPKIAPPLNLPDFDKAKVEVKKATSVEVNLITLGK